MPTINQLVNKRRKVRPAYVIKFKETKSTWFTLWNDNIISPYNNEQKPTISMRRYLDEIYQQDLVDTILNMFDARKLKFVNLACMR